MAGDTHAFEYYRAEADEARNARPVRAPARTTEVEHPDNVSIRQPGSTMPSSTPQAGSQWRSSDTRSLRRRIHHFVNGGGGAYLSNRPGTEALYPLPEGCFQAGVSASSLARIVSGLGQNAQVLTGLHSGQARGSTCRSRQSPLASWACRDRARPGRAPMRRRSRRTQAAARRRPRSRGLHSETAAWLPRWPGSSSHTMRTAAQVGLLIAEYSSVSPTKNGRRAINCSDHFPVASGAASARTLIAMRLTPAVARGKLTESGPISERHALRPFLNMDRGSAYEAPGRVT